MMILINTLAVLFHISGGLILCFRFFAKGKHDLLSLLIGAICSAASCGIYFCDAGDHRGLILAGIEVVCIWACGIYRMGADKRMSLFTACFYKMGVHLLTLLASAGMTIALKDKAFLDDLTLRGSLISLAVGGVVLILCIVLWRNKDMTARALIRVGTFIALAALFAVNFLITYDSDLLNKEDLFTWMYYALGLMVAVLMIQMSRQYEAEKELARMKSEEAMMLEREYRALSNTYESNAKLFHDFRNHCGVIRNYLTKDKNEEALKYLDDLTDGGSSYSLEVWTGDETIDYLIGSKKSLAGEKQIAFDVNAEFPRNINIKSSDLCAILGNLLDNAIEAASKIEDPSGRRVRLAIRRIQQMLVVKVENTYANRPVVIDGDYKTSKTDGGLHGWGIKSAGAAAEKYDGMVQSSCTDTLFTTVVTLSFEGIKPE